MENNKEYQVTTNEEEMWNNIDPKFKEEYQVTTNEEEMWNNIDPKFYDNYSPLWSTAITLLVVIASFIGLMLLFFA